MTHPSPFNLAERTTCRPSRASPSMRSDRWPTPVDFQPAQMWWEPGDWKEGKTVKDDFSYTSDSNTSWLTVEDLQGIVANL